MTAIPLLVFAASSALTSLLSQSHTRSKAVAQQPAPFIAFNKVNGLDIFRFSSAALTAA